MSLNKSTTIDEKNLLTRVQQLTELTSKQQKEIDALKKTIKSQDVKLNKLEAVIPTIIQSKLNETNDLITAKLSETNDLIAALDAKHVDLDAKINNLTPQNNGPVTFASLFKTEATKANILNTLDKERQAQDNKKYNLVITGVSLPDDPTHAEIHDQDVVKAMAQDLNINLDNTKFTTRRVGKINDNNCHKIVLRMITDKRKDFLKKARDLRLKPRWENIYINPDLTRAQEEAQYILRVELREKRQAEHTKKWIIKRGKIVEDNSRPNTPAAAILDL